MWHLKPWAGSLEPELTWDGKILSKTWSGKARFNVRGAPSCTELGVLDQARNEGWDGVWVSAYHRFLRQEWFTESPSELHNMGAPPTAVGSFLQLVEANDGSYRGIFDVFLWRDQHVRFAEVKVGRDRIGTNQEAFVALHHRLGRASSELLIVKVPRPVF